MYLGETFSTLHMKSVEDWSKHFESWPEDAPICVHAEGNSVAAVILVSYHNELQAFETSGQLVPD